MSVNSLPNLELKMFNERLSLEQNLELDAKIALYFKDALMCDKGYVVFESIDTDIFEFDFYYSLNFEIIPRIEETRGETINRILFCIDCEELHKIVDLNAKVPNIMWFLKQHIVGQLSMNALHRNYGLLDCTPKFRNEVADA